VSQLRWGLRVTEMSWPVFPVRGKHPLVKGWPTKATTDPAQIREWTRQFPRMTGWGILTAWDRAVFDVDLPQALAPEFAAMVETWPGPKVLTGKGVHCYGIANKGQRNRIRPTEGADVKAGGGFVLAPGSLHPKTGRHYVEVNPITTPLPVFPPELLDLLPQPYAERIWPRRRVMAPTAARRTLAEAEDRMLQAQPGERNNVLYMAARDVEPYVSGRVIDIRDAVRHLEDAATVTGLDPTEVRRTIFSAFTRKP
jgi:putative DNA primase/helicase